MHRQGKHGNAEWHYLEVIRAREKVVQEKKEELGMKEEGEIGRCKVELLDVKEDYADMLVERWRRREARGVYKEVARGREHEHGVEQFATL